MKCNYANKSNNHYDAHSIIKKVWTHFDFLVWNLSVSNENSPTLSWGKIFLTVIPHSCSSYSSYLLRENTGAGGFLLTLRNKSYFAHLFLQNAWSVSFLIRSRRTTQKEILCTMVKLSLQICFIQDLEHLNCYTGI